MSKNPKRKEWKQQQEKDWQASTPTITIEPVEPAQPQEVPQEVPQAVQRPMSPAGTGTGSSRKTLAERAKKFHQSLHSTSLNHLQVAQLDGLYAVPDDKREYNHQLITLGAMLSANSDFKDMYIPDVEPFDDCQLAFPNLSNKPILWKLVRDQHESEPF